MTSLAEIRTTFLDHFSRAGHEVVPSSPLVPRNDPTLMFVNSGMVQFKNLFTGQERRDYTRATTAQKCVRAGGKHNDLDNVGYTRRHHTFFEMLGNFSFGDYFKSEAIPLAWDLVTRKLGIDAGRLLVTIYRDDDEAAGIWRKVGVPDERIIRIATDDNFWMMGPTGPCGPCSEIFYDHGDRYWGGPPGTPEEDGDRFVEIWNLVFMQFEQHEDGSRTDLPRPSIDTGMGIERVAALLQGTNDNFATDLMRALIEASAHATSTEPDGPARTHHRVIADHLRSCSFLIADGVMPANDGRGYVLRRIMRRAMRHARQAGADEPLMWRLVPELVRQMGQAYPELVQAQALVEETLRAEETRFRQTLDRGLRLLHEEVARLPEGADLPGEAAFKLYDTYGFPVDLTQDALRERNRGVDLNAFEAAMDAQRMQARAAWAGSGESADASIWFDMTERHGATEFLGYDTEEAEGQILAVLRDFAEVDGAGEGEEVAILLNQTPFYAEAGGQVGDTGAIETDTGRARVTDTRKHAGVFIHFATVEGGRIEPGQGARLAVDHERRSAIRSNHSATHLLHEALRRHLGDHVAQRGSLNAPDRLRFDFSHGRALTPEQVAAVEEEVNAYVRRDDPVTTRIMTPDEARGLGAQALFGEKYGDEVRVVSMGRLDGSGKGADGATYSIELCGGTHVPSTGRIGLFAVTDDAASSAGVRRVEAITGEAARAHLVAQERQLAEAARVLKARPEDVPTRVKALLVERQELIEARRSLQTRLATEKARTELEPKNLLQVLGDTIDHLPEQPAGGIGGERFDPNRVRCSVAVLRDTPAKSLRSIIDSQKDKVGSGFVILFSEDESTRGVAVGVTDNLTDRLDARDIIKVLSRHLGGKGGGGRRDFAQGGISTTDKDLVQQAVNKANKVISSSLFGSA